MGYNSQIISVDGANLEKGEPDDEVVVNIVGEKGKHGYERGYAKVKDFRDQVYDSDDQKDPIYLKPYDVDVVAPTIRFGSLRIVDFLCNYYAAQDTDPSGYGNLEAGKSKTGGQYSSFVESLAKLRAVNEHLSYDLNCLDMSWFHDDLIKIELAPDETKIPQCEAQDLQDAKDLDKMVKRFEKTFLQQRMLHQEASGLSGGLLKRICQRFSECASEVHRIARECKSHVKHSKHDKSAKSYEGDNNGECIKFNVDLDSKHPLVDEFALVAWPYMWGNDWEYYWKENMECEEGEYWQMCCALDRAIANLKDLANRTPKNCIVLELVIHLKKQAECISGTGFPILGISATRSRSRTVNITVMENITVTTRVKIS